MNTATPTLEAYLLELWKASELYFGEKTQITLGGTMFTAWDIDADRVVMKFIVDRPRYKPAFDDLSLDLAQLLHAEVDTMRDEEIALGHDDDEALEMAQASGPYYIDVYVLESAIDMETRQADLLGVYAPQLFIHVVPDALLKDAA